MRSSFISKRSNQINHKMKKKEIKLKKVKAWADIGSHGGIFEFIGGAFGSRYPHLMHVFSERVSPDLVEVTITYNPTKSK